jgi:hypothetical protein
MKRRSLVFVSPWHVGGVIALGTRVPAEWAGKGVFSFHPQESHSIGTLRSSPVNPMYFRRHLRPSFLIATLCPT